MTRQANGFQPRASGTRKEKNKMDSGFFDSTSRFPDDFGFSLRFLFVCRIPVTRLAPIHIRVFRTTNNS